MKKILCLLVGAALLGACEEKTVVSPTAPADKKTENNTTVVNPASTVVKEKTKETTNTSTNTNTTTTSPSSNSSSTTTTTTSSSPNP